MSGRTEKRGFAARPSDPDGWIKASDASPARATAATAYTARLTIDVTPELRGRIRSLPSDAAALSPTCCVSCSRASSPTRQEIAHDQHRLP